MERRLARATTILDIAPIEGADAIECATVEGWKVVVKKGDFKVGDLVVYLEIDAWVPHELAPYLSKGKEPAVYEGIPGARLRTVRLRGQISQGLILPLDVLPENVEAFDGLDLTEIMGIMKWEAAIPAQLAGRIKGSFPSFLKKTDSERIQGLKWLYREFPDLEFVGHEKLDGSSCTIYYNNGIFGVCSRNLDLVEEEGNSFWKIARMFDLETHMVDMGRNISVQLELIGEGIQKNRYGVKGLSCGVFDVFDIDRGCYLDVDDAKDVAAELGIPMWCPYVITLKLSETPLEELLLIAEGKSARNPKVEREGIVFRPRTETWHPKMGRVAFKVISNKFLLNGGD